MVAPEHKIVNFNFVSPFMSTEYTNKCLANTAVDLPQGRPSFCPSVRGPRSTFLSPMDFSSPLEVNYAEHILMQNRMDVELDDIPALTNQHL